jgi:hypothetical protein
MRRLWLIPVVFVVLAIPVAVLAAGGEGGFDGVVRSIESRYSVRATRIPFMGLMSFVSRCATHGAVGNLHIAEFERFTAPVDGDELNALVEEKLGSGWERIIRDTRGHGDEQSLIFIRPEGRRMGLFVVDADRGEMDVVQVSVDPDHLDDDIGHYRHHHQRNDQGQDGQD